MDACAPNKERTHISPKKVLKRSFHKKFYDAIYMVTIIAVIIYHYVWIRYTISFSVCNLSTHISYWVPNKPPTITAKLCTIFISTHIEKSVIPITTYYSVFWVQNSTTFTD